MASGRERRARRAPRPGPTRPPRRGGHGRLGVRLRSGVPRDGRARSDAVAHAPAAHRAVSRRRRRGDFRNLLPDGAIRQQVCHQLGVSEGNEFALLGVLGGDCPGALNVLPPGDDAGPGDSSVRPLTELELRNVVAALPLHPLLAEVEGARFALPGEHHKMPVRVEGDRLAITLGNTLSSHIVKPAKPGLRESVMNEGFCLELARAAGLPVANATVRHGAVTILLVERVDRDATDTGWTALHMEDFCQLTGTPPEKKYEREGGLRIEDCVDVIRRYSSMPAVDLRTFLAWLAFNFLIGNGGGARETARAAARRGRSPARAVLRLVLDARLPDAEPASRDDDRRGGSAGLADPGALARDGFGVRDQGLVRARDTRRDGGATAAPRYGSRGHGPAYARIRPRHP